MNENINLEKLNIKEGARYLGYGNNTPDDNVMNIIKQCEDEIIKTARPRYTYKVFDVTIVDEGVNVEGTSLLLKGNSIKEHLLGCNKAVLLCATLSSEIDRLIRVTEIRDMAKAVIMDAFAGVAIEQICEKIEIKVKNKFQDKFFTYRFGLGYGDLPIEHETEFLGILDTQKLIGVTVNDNFIMSPRKTVACIIGISDNEINSKKKGCISCNMRERCQYRLRGDRCGF